MRTIPTLLFAAAVALAGCATPKSDSLYQPVETATSDPTQAQNAGDQTTQDAQQLDEAKSQRADALREQRENDDD